MLQNLYIMKVDKRLNSTKQCSIENAIISTQVRLKRPTDIHNPTFIITVPEDKLEEALSCNYAYQTDNYYWINSIVTISNTQLEITCKLDVLATFKTEILNTTAYVVYSDNLGRLSIYDERNAHLVLDRVISTEPVTPNMTNSLDEGVYLLQVSNTLINSHYGGISMYLLTQYELGWIISTLMKDDFLSECSKYRLKPNDFIHGCFWLPTNIDTLVKASDYGIADIIIGDYKVKSPDGNVMQGKWLNTPKVFSEEVILPLPEGLPLETYLYSSDVCKVLLYLPCYGYVELLNSVLYSANQLTIDIKVDVYSCNISYKVKVLDTILGIYSATYGTQIPVSSSTMNIGALISGISSVATTIGGIATKRPQLALYGLNGIAHSIGAYTQLNNSTGSIGSTLPVQTENQILLSIFTTTLADNPITIKSTIGLPYNKITEISNCEGYCQTANFSIALQACRDEIEEINNFLDGGIYIE